MGIFKHIKNGLKCIIPPPTKTFNREINRVVNGLDEIEKKLGNYDILLGDIMQAQKQQEEILCKITNIKIDNLNKLMEIQTDNLSRIIGKDGMINNVLVKQDEIFNKIDEYREKIKGYVEEESKIISSEFDKVISKIDVNYSSARNQAWQSIKTSNEILWAEIFNNTISNSEWLIDKSFSPGRWAVGYQYLYVVYRILNEIKPKKILELGLGQSTKLIGQYVKNNEDVKHIVTEHDPKWIKFFTNNWELPTNTSVYEFELVKEPFRDDDSVVAYLGFSDKLKNNKFDFISIDAPFGYEAIIYARADVLNLLPECLEESFVIIVDDYNRQGEKNTVKELEIILAESNIKYVKGVYSGQKDCIIICSEDYEFICSM